MLFIGDPGTGKTRDAQKLLEDLYGPKQVYTKTSGNKWFSFYEGEKGVILDEYSGSTLCFAQLLQLCDRGRHVVETKGVDANWLAETIIITSNFEPTTWYSKPGLKLGALYRRFSAVRVYTGNDTFTEFLANPEAPEDRDGMRLMKLTLEAFNGRQLVAGQDPNFVTVEELGRGSILRTPTQ